MISPRSSSAHDERLDAAKASLDAGRIGQAVGVLRALVADAPGSALAQLQLAIALEASGDRIGAEIPLRAARLLDPTSGDVAGRLANLLMGRRQAAEAVDILAPFADLPHADIDLLTAHGEALKMLGRLDEAAVIYRRATDAAPASGVAEHNLAGALGEAHRFAESEAATRRAFAKGLDAPETWLVRGRSLRGLLEFDEAEVAFRKAVQRRGAYADAHTDLAQLIWMRTENLGQAREELDRAIASHPSEIALRLALAKLLQYAGDTRQAYAVLEDPLASRPTDPVLLVVAASLIVDTDPDLALEYATTAFGAAPESAPIRTAFCQANLAVGRADVAAGIAEALCREWPLDQYPVALAATAWRMLGDPRYYDLYDYDRLVRVQTIETPTGWASLAAYLADLAAHLRGLQRLQAHPIGQSLRHGVQTEQSLALSKDPVIAAFFTAIDPAIRAYMQALRNQDDVLGRRLSDGYRFSGAWSVLLRPGGYHVGHLHPLGWISSACHISLPQAVEKGQEGWLKFGEPGLPTNPPLAPEHFVKPRAGDLVLFPSYMWHGTVPFGGEESRLSVAFDLLPS